MALSSGKINGSTGGDHDFWNSGPSLSQTEPDALSEWLEAKILSAGENWSINFSTKTLQMAIGWDKDVDVDASAALFDQHLRNIDSVYYKNPQDSCGSVVHSGDNHTGYGDGDEIITVHLTKLPLEVHYVLFAVTLYNSNMTFSEINNVSVAMRYGEKGSKGSDVFRLPLSDLSGSAVLVGQLVRLGARWEFKALGVPTTGRTIDAVLQDPSVTEHMSKSISSAPILRHIRVSVLKGRNLAPKDISLLTLAKRTSDPYYRATFRDRDVESEYQKKTLNPVWQPQTLDLGLIAESQPDVLEISVFDHDRFNSDDFMGLVHVAAGDLYHLEPGEKHTYWFTLGKSQDSKYANEEVSGEILIEIDITAIAGQENEV